MNSPSEAADLFGISLLEVDSMVVNGHLCSQCFDYIENCECRKCEDCKEFCEGTWTDFGIGAYEYWGAKCFQTNWSYVSECCEGTVLEGKRNLTDDPPPQEERP